MPDDGSTPEELTPPAYERDAGRWTMETAASRTRSHLRDVAAKNHLDFGQVKFEWREIYDALEDALSDWNGTAPLSDHDMLTIDKRAQPLLRDFAVARLLRSAAQEDARNQLNYADQGFSVSENDKAPLYLQVAGQIEASYDQSKRQLKTALNMAATWGGVHHNSFEDPFGYWESVPGEL